MKNNLIIIFLLGISLTSFAFIPVFQSYINTNVSDSFENILKVDYRAETTLQTTLGWEIDEVRNIFVEHSDSGTEYINVRCKAITEHVVVLAEEEFHNQKSYDYCLGFAERFQREVYEPTAIHIGLPRVSTVDNSSDIALIFADLADGIMGNFEFSSLNVNGFESITGELSAAYEIFVHEYQHCIHRNYRTDSDMELWFNEGMSETLPVILGFSTSNESTFLPYFTGEESSVIKGPNTPLLYWDIRDDYGFRRANYGGSFAFVFYVYEHYGLDFLGDVLKNTDYNITESFNRVLIQNGYDKTFKDLLADWALAVRLDDPQLNPLWNYKWLNVNAQYENQMAPPSDGDLPVEFNGKVFDAAGATYKLNIRSDSVNAIKYDFDGRTPGEYRVYLIASEYVNTSFSKKYFAKINIDPVTQNGSGFIMLPNDAMYVELLVVNTHFKNTDIDYMKIAPGTDVETLRKEFYCDVSAFDPNLTGLLESIIYNNGTFHIEAVIEWDLEESLEDYGMNPHIVLYDGDGEFAFNLQAYLTYDETSGKWIGDLDITEDIKSGDYVIKLFMQGKELDNESTKVSKSSNASGFLLLPSFLAIIVITLKKEK